MEGGAGGSPGGPGPLCEVPPVLGCGCGFGDNFGDRQVCWKCGAARHGGGVALRKSPWLAGHLRRSGQGSRCAYGGALPTAGRRSGTAGPGCPGWLPLFARCGSSPLEWSAHGRRRMPSCRPCSGWLRGRLERSPWSPTASTSAAAPWRWPPTWEGRRRRRCLGGRTATCGVLWRFASQGCFACRRCGRGWRRRPQAGPPAVPPHWAFLRLLDRGGLTAGLGGRRPAVHDVPPVAGPLPLEATSGGCTLVRVAGAALRPQRPFVATLVRLAALGRTAAARPRPFLWRPATPCSEGLEAGVVRGACRSAFVVVLVRPVPVCAQAAPMQR